MWAACRRRLHAADSLADDVRLGLQTQAQDHHYEGGEGGEGPRGEVLAVGEEPRDAEAGEGGADAGREGGVDAGEKEGRRCWWGTGRGSGTQALHLRRYVKSTPEIPPRLLFTPGAVTTG